VNALTTRLKTVCAKVDQLLAVSLPAARPIRWSNESNQMSADPRLHAVYTFHDFHLDQRSARDRDRALADAGLSQRIADPPVAILYQGVGR
jgi:hypothetical protein